MYRFVGFLCLLLPGPLLGQGAPPLFTDDTGIAAYQTTEWRVIGFLDWRKGIIYGEGPTIDMGRGILPQMEVSFTGALVHCKEEEHTVYGVGYLAGSWKWRFYQSKVFMLSTGLSLISYGKHISRSCSALSPESSLFWPLGVQWYVGSWTLGAEGGLFFYPKIEHEYSVGFYVGKQVSRKLMWAAEIYRTGALGAGMRVC